MCTGDVRFGGTGEVQTQFTVRSPGSNPGTRCPTPVVTGCQQTYAGYNGNLAVALDRSNAGFNADVADNFRQWRQLCRVNGNVRARHLPHPGQDQRRRQRRRQRPQPLQPAGLGTNKSRNDDIAVAGYQKMAMYGNTPSGTSRFFLARVPSGARGQLFTVRLFDIGDGATVRQHHPRAAALRGRRHLRRLHRDRRADGALTDCTINVSSSYNGKWQSVSVPMPGRLLLPRLGPDGLLAAAGVLLRPRLQPQRHDVVDGEHRG